LRGIFLEHSVDDILANIRKSVESELDNLTAASPKPGRGGRMRQALQEMRQTMPADDLPRTRPHDDVLDLRSRIKRKVEAMETSREIVPAPAPRPVAAAPARRDFSGILAGAPQPAPALRPSFADEDFTTEVYAAPPPPQWQVEEHYQTYETQAPVYDDHTYAEAAPIISPDTEALTEQSFQELSNAILARAAGERSLEDMTRDILHGLLKQWLDANLPGIVEAMVREEIQRVARRGR
jgi:uncharacterized protein